MTAAFFTLLVCFIGGALQSLIGFGCAIIMMALLPYLISPIPLVSGMTSVICFLCSLALTLKYRRPVHLRRILPVFAAYLVLLPISNRIALALPPGRMKLYLGLALVLMSAYYLMCSGKTLRLPRTLPVALAVGMLSGILSGLFTMGGPPVVLYAMSASDDKEDYLGMIQFYFTITNLSNSVVRIAAGVITPAVLPWIAVGMTGTAAGMLAAKPLQGRLNWDALRRWTYVMIGVVGVNNILSAL
ncbi:sulfite exporter TauE/SafE family protein [Oscillibacter sp. MSJ-2]|uniref:Probable membrane transporter protein n=1 Tax=Dysosmobacter acutus TaxID=2841504 RepID=A0ABS6FCZ7_9FIRM|nr:sulfite exporter TauE/SafE family protein [Dysosmobacter acutus]MBU5627442.1 sulfite exporter TauE/SafE family protein [Dysosmobacter acutus]